MKRISFLTVIILALIGCGQKQANKNQNDPVVDTIPKAPVIERKIMALDTTIKISNVDVWVLSPEGDVKADILVLPGWNYVKEKICKESDFCDKALGEGYRLILPEMMKSLYASQYYEETRSDYHNFIKLGWVTDSLIPRMQEDYNAFQGKENYIHGISTGARGAALVHLSTGTLFNKVVLLSGDYNNIILSEDNLLTNLFGPYEDFHERWMSNDNPYAMADKWTASVYIGHGKKDRVVETKHSMGFADRLMELHPALQVDTNYPGDAGHNFKFWGGETEKILEFFKN